MDGQAGGDGARGIDSLCMTQSKDIVFVKENTLELLACVGESEPVSICETSLYGCVKCCQRVPHNAAFPFVETAHPSLAGCDLLVLLSTSGKLSFVGVKQNRSGAAAP